MVIPGEKMKAVVVSHGKIAIPDSWLSEHRDFSGYMDSEAAKELLTELQAAVTSLEPKEVLGSDG